MNDQTNQPPASEEKPAGFCQQCGKPLNAETVRVVGQAVFCEPCLEARLAGAPAGPPYAGTPGGGYTTFRPPLLPSGPPNPGLAALLGIIPGVGAMYNEQYGKGIIHLMVFAVLISLSHASGLFGFMAFAWMCYMVIEAHHTARARRDGLPLPNPFGLNEISERLGFQSNTFHGSASNGPPPAPWQTPGAGGATPPYAAPAASATGAEPPVTASPAYMAPVYSAPPYPGPTGHWGAPADAGTAYGGAWANPAGFTAGPASAPYAPVTPPIAGSYPAPDAEVAARLAVQQRSRFPAGAVLLIGLGVLLLLTTTGVFRGFPPASLIGFGLIGLAVWLFLRRMLETGTGVASDGSAWYQMRVLRALRMSVWVFLVGILLLLNSFHVLQLYRSWPWFIVLAGLMMLLERLVYASAHAVPPGMPYAAPPATGPVNPAPETRLTRQEGDN